MTIFQCHSIFIIEEVGIDKEINILQTMNI